eukprot:423835_1
MSKKKENKNQSSGEINALMQLNIPQQQTECKEMEQTSNTCEMAVNNNKNRKTWDCSLCITVNDVQLTKCQLCTIPRHVIIHTYEKNISEDLEDKVYFVEPFPILSNYIMIAKYFRTVWTMYSNSIGMDFSDLQVVKSAAEWMFIDWETATNVSMQVDDIIDENLTIEDILTEVIRIEWEECYFRWTKWHYFRNDTNKKMEILSNLMFKEIARQLQ